MRYLIGICAFLCAALPSPVLHAASGHKDLVLQGEVYPNSCNVAQKKNLHGELIRGEVVDMGQAWRAIELILCGANTIGNRRRLMSLLSKEVLEKTESTGDDTKARRVIKSAVLVKDLMTVRDAWNSSIIAHQEEIFLQYFVNEACVKSAKFVYKRYKWSVSEIGEACD
jgi:hypothetical protein